MDYKIISPSMGRANSCMTHKYLPMLSYVVDSKEADAYKKMHKKIIVPPDGFQGKYPRICNWILDNCGDNVLIVDDDIKAFGRWENQKGKRLSTDDAMEFIDHGFCFADQLGVHYWGMNILVDKGAYREYTPLGFTSYIGGPFQAHLKNECRYDERMILKEDYDMALQVLNRYRRNLRFNMYYFIANQHDNKGGCANYRTMKKEQEQNELLMKKWGNKIIKYDSGTKTYQRKKKNYDINPILKIPIRGV